MWICYHDNAKLRALTGSVGKGSDHLQLIKFWPPPPREGVCGGANIFGSALLQPACSVCVASEHFFSFPLLLVTISLELCTSYSSNRHHQLHHP